MKTITIGNKTCTVEWLTGKVVGQDKGRETRVHGGGGGGYTHNGSGYNNPVHISSTTIVHDNIYLEDNKGVEHAIKLENWDVACREGHIMTLVWLADKGTYIAIHNRTTNQTLFSDKLKRFFRLSLQAILIVFGAVALFLGWLTASVYWGVLLAAFVAFIVHRRFWKQSAMQQFKSGLNFNEFN